jgi:hypothetical protein
MKYSEEKNEIEGQENDFQKKIPKLIFWEKIPKVNLIH